jgi:hypothetical protein
LRARPRLRLIDRLRLIEHYVEVVHPMAEPSGELSTTRRQFP